MLSLNNISIGYRTKTVACHLSAHLDRGAFTCLIGSNGTGKSTLLRTIATFQPPLGGTITINLPHPTDITTLSPQQKAQAIGVVLTERTMPGNMTVRDMVAMGRSPYTGFWGRLSKKDNDIIDNAMLMIGITPLEHNPMTALSDGERQKVMIAKALAQQTPIIILDEPTAFLDYPSKIATMQTLKRLCHEEGKTVLLSTHDLDAALRIADDVWLMANGALTTGTLQTLKTEITEFMRV